MSERVQNFFKAVQISGISMDQVTKAADVPNSTVWRWQNGKPMRGTAALERLEQALKTMISEREEGFKAALSLLPTSDGATA